MNVRFVKGATRRYRSVFRRDDGVEVAFDGGSYNRVGGAELPHDIAHLIVEDELALARGVWGVLEAGGMFGHATVVAGRRRPHATEHGRRLVREASEEVMQAEVLVRAVCDAGPDVAALRRAVGDRYWSPAVTAEAVERAVGRMREAADAWRRLGVDEALEFEVRFA